LISIITAKIKKDARRHPQSLTKINFLLLFHTYSQIVTVGNPVGRQIPLPPYILQKIVLYNCFCTPLTLKKDKGLM
ncbi:MAG: hypothetical protein KIG87_02090, partial [Muribaculaceae bacterium]|nr:hypothetical protein [Muribaculaceae bacterium]